jgi:hypothetical protein
VPHVPAQPGEELHGKVHVIANGGQRFLVDVQLSITGRTGSLNAVAVNVPVLTAADVVSVKETVREAVTAAEREPQKLLDVVPLYEDGEQPGGFRKHLLPLGILALLLFSVVMHDLGVIFLSRTATHSDATDITLIDPNPYLFIRFHDYQGEIDLPNPTMRFGLLAREGDHPDQVKKLTFNENGLTNNTIIRLDGRQFIFRQNSGSWVELKSKLQGETDGRPRDGWASVWSLADDKLRVTQEVEIIPGTQSRRLDTCLVRYILENRDTRPHRVGIRFMLDTYIGENDGVPFIIPGASDLCDTKMAFDTPDRVPDFIQALENEDPSDPGTVAYLQFRIGKNIESPSRVLLSGWPNPELRELGVARVRGTWTGWEVPFISIKERIRAVDRETRRREVFTTNDSAVTMYWNEQTLEPGKARVVGFSYGLGSVDTRESGGHLLLTVGGRLVPNVEFTLTALIHQPKPGETLTLDLPAGLEAEGQQPTQAVPPVPPGASRPDSPITWRLRAAKDGRYEIAVRSSTGATQKLPLMIRTRGVFD